MWSLLVFSAIAAIGAVSAAPKPNHYSQLSRYETLEDVMNRRPLRNFDALKLGGGYGVEKRYPAAAAKNSNKFETRSEKHHRGPSLNGLIPGGGFGRAARGYPTIPELNYDKIKLLLKYQPNEYPFDVDSRNESSDRQLVKALMDKSGPLLYQDVEAAFTNQ